MLCVFGKERLNKSFVSFYTPFTESFLSSLDKFIMTYSIISFFQNIMYRRTVLRSHQAFFIFFYFSFSDSGSPYYGHFIGKLSNREQNLFGQLFAVDKNTVFIQNFTYLHDTRKTIYILKGGQPIADCLFLRPSKVYIS